MYQKSYDSWYGSGMAKTHTIRPARSYATTEARTRLPQLVNELVGVTEPGDSLFSHAVEVGPRHRGGVVMLPSIDVEAALEREAAMQAQVEALEDELENIAIGLLLTDRIARSSGATVSADDVIRGLGHGDLLDG